MRSEKRLRQNAHSHALSGKVEDGELARAVGLRLQCQGAEQLY